MTKKEFYEMWKGKVEVVQETTFFRTADFWKDLTKLLISERKREREMYRLGIIGTAGRKRPVEEKHLRFILNQCMAEIDSLELPDEEITLVSGGAAGADFAAIVIHLKYGIPIELHFPCGWDFENRRFIDTGSVNWRTNPGGTANYYHRKFTESLNDSAFLFTTDSLLDIHYALTSENRGQVQVTYGDGFLGRNDRVAKDLNRLLAFTFGKQEPTDGGTLNTWKKAIENNIDCRHFSLAAI